MLGPPVPSRPVANITFDSFRIEAPANGQAIIGQGYAFGGVLTDSATAAAWSYYVLSNITADKTLTLPAGVATNSIKFTNMSAFSATGVYEKPAYTWTIVPNGSQKIMRTTSLLLDESTSSFELYYTDSANGWVINGIS